MASGDTVDSRVRIPGVDFSQPHKYGWLWVPATDTTQGYAKTYFDGAEVAGTIRWNKYDPALSPPPLPGGSAWSVMDVRHLAPIIGTGAKNPLTVYGMEVWQASAAENVVH